MSVILGRVSPWAGMIGNSGDKGKFRHKKTALSARLADDGSGVRHRGRAGAAAFGRRAAMRFVMSGHMLVSTAVVNRAQGSGIRDQVLTIPTLISDPSLDSWLLIPDP
jgi:hypothetical protein